MTVFPNSSIVSQLSAIVVTVFDGLCACRLYQNPVVLTGTTVVGDFVEADFGGYVPISPATWQAVTLADVMTALCKQVPAIFTCDGTAPANDVYGAFFTNGGALLGAIEFPAGPIHVDTLGEQVSVGLDLLLGPRGETV